VKNSTAVQYLALICAALACSGDSVLTSNVSLYCQKVLDLTFTVSNITGYSQQPTRSVFQIAKWGSLSLLLPILFDTNNNGDKDTTQSVQGLISPIFAEGIDSVEATPSIALIHLFNCVLGCARYQFLGKIINNPADNTIKLSTSMKKKYLPSDKVIEAMFILVEGCCCSTDSMYMLDEVCTFVIVSN
jgi:hypothetical protein